MNNSGFSELRRKVKEGEKLHQELFGDEGVYYKHGIPMNSDEINQRLNRELNKLEKIIENTLKQANNSEQLHLSNWLEHRIDSFIEYYLLEVIPATQQISLGYAKYGFEYNWNKDRSKWSSKKVLQEVYPAELKNEKVQELLKKAKDDISDAYEKGLKIYLNMIYQEYKEDLGSDLNRQNKAELAIELVETNLDFHILEFMRSFRASLQFGVKSGMTWDGLMSLIKHPSILDKAKYALGNSTVRDLSRNIRSPNKLIEKTNKLKEFKEYLKNSNEEFAVLFKNNSDYLHLVELNFFLVKISIVEELRTYIQAVYLVYKYFSTNEKLKKLQTSPKVIFVCSLRVVMNKNIIAQPDDLQDILQNKEDLDYLEDFLTGDSSFRNTSSSEPRNTIAGLLTQVNNLKKLTPAERQNLWEGILEQSLKKEEKLSVFFENNSELYDSFILYVNTKNQRKSRNLKLGNEKNPTFFILGKQLEFINKELTKRSDFYKQRCKDAQKLYLRKSFAQFFNRVLDRPDELKARTTETILGSKQIKSFIHSLESNLSNDPKIQTLKSHLPNVSGKLVRDTLGYIKLKETEDGRYVDAAINRTFGATLVHIYEYVCELFDIDPDMANFDPEAITDSNFFTVLSEALNAYFNLLANEIIEFSSHYQVVKNKLSEFSQRNIHLPTEQLANELRSILSMESKTFDATGFPQELFEAIYSSFKDIHKNREYEIGNNEIKVYNYEQRLTKVSRDGEEYETHYLEKDTPQIEVDTEFEIYKLIDSLSQIDLNLLEKRESRKYYHLKNEDNFNLAKLAVKFILKEMMLDSEENNQVRTFVQLAELSLAVDPNGKLGKESVEQCWNFFMLIKGFELRELLSS